MIGECLVPTNVVFDKDGYPRFKWKRRLWRMNRFMWHTVYGEIPEGMVVAHKCNNKGCINPTHFYLTTPQQNSTDAARDGLYQTGASHHNFKATEDIVKLILHKYHVLHLSQDVIAKELGFSQSHISHIITRNKE